MKKFRNALKGNKGFTLVELIIVVAVIAVLAAVLAPQYLRYVERARESNDLQVAASIMRAATVAVADPQNGASGEYEIKWTTSADAPALTVNGVDSTEAAVTKAIAQVMGWADAGTGADEAQSTAGQGTDFSFTLNAATGQVSDVPAAWGENGIGVNP